MTQLATPLLAAPRPQRRFTVEEYNRLIEVGILTKNDHVELLHGEIVEMSPIGSPHNSVVMRLNMHFSSLGQERVLVSIQGPMELGTHSEPQPDVLVLKPRKDGYRTRNPRASDVLLLIEVADSSLWYDRHVKLPLYAGDAVAEAWVVDVNSQSVEVCTQPSGEAYGGVRRYTRAQSLAPAAFPDHVLSLDDLFA